MTMTSATSHVISGTTRRSDGNWSEDRMVSQLADLKRLVSRRHGGVPQRVVWTEQVHGAQVLPITDEDGPIGPGDALITDRPDVLLTVRTADCVPVFLEAEGAVGIVHAGLAGALKQIVPRAIRAMRREYKIRPDDLQIRFGPHICSSCYEMSPNNLALLEKYPEAKKYASPRGSRRFFSLIDLLVSQVAELGVRRLEADPRCTYHDAELFSSRRGHDHRQVSFVMLTRPGATIPAPINSRQDA
ncbi:MAG: polyphenol oxidase family protein [Patescibacteria group bacterium]|nr:polyphenol oxidase family protein [Patescibacteria group bacterium]